MLITLDPVSWKRSGIFILIRQGQMFKLKRRQGMKHKSLSILGVLLVLSIFIPTGTDAQPYAITWWTVDGGGGTSSGGGYILSGTIGQPDAGVMTGGDYALTGGFWSFDAFHLVFLPLILRN